MKTLGSIALYLPLAAQFDALQPLLLNLVSSESIIKFASYYSARD